MKTRLLRFLKLIGFFWLARRLTRKSLRVLCYHGVSIGDQHEFEDILFIRAETFRRRMELIKKWKFPVLPLRDAVTRLETGTLPAGATAITIDDGWYSTFQHQVPVLVELQLPATVYVTTYYVEKETEVFNVLMRYCFWKSRDGVLDLGKIDPALSGQFDLADDAQRGRALDAILAGGESTDAPGRQSLAQRAASALGLNFSEIRRHRGFQMMKAEEVEAAEAGVDIQLHTHRHRLPVDDEAAFEREILENRRSLTQMGVAGPLDQLCYPSGVFQRGRRDLLERLSVHNSTTCEPGLNPQTTDRYFLNRFLDREKVSDLEFEAELCGVLELLRRRPLWA